MKVPLKASWLKHWINTETLWNRKEVSRASPEIAARRLLISTKNDNQHEQMGLAFRSPLAQKCVYWWSMRISRISARLPRRLPLQPLWQWLKRIEEAKVSTTVVSHVRHMPACQGTRVRPSIIIIIVITIIIIEPLTPIGGWLQDGRGENNRLRHLCNKKYSLLFQFWHHFYDFSLSLKIGLQPPIYD